LPDTTFASAEGRRSVCICRRPGGVGAEPPTCFRDSEHTGPCQTRGRGAEPPGAQRQPNLQLNPARLVLLLSVSQPNLPNNAARYVLLINPVPKLRSQPIENVLLLSVSQPNLPNTPTGHVLLTIFVIWCSRLGRKRVPCSGEAPGPLGAGCGWSWGWSCAAAAVSDGVCATNRPAGR
jgi:hypothetical protein